MHQTTRSSVKLVVVALIIGSFLPPIWAQPRPVETASPAGPKPGPGLGGPTISVSGPAPGLAGVPMFQGIITDDEFKEFTAFQQQINADPAIKELNAKIAKLTQEIQQLRVEANATREKLLAANPRIKAIQNKITAAMHTRASPGPGGPMPLPMPPPAKTK